MFNLAEAQGIELWHFDYVSPCLMSRWELNDSQCRTPQDRPNAARLLNHPFLADALRPSASGQLPDPIGIQSPYKASFLSHYIDILVVSVVYEHTYISQRSLLIRHGTALSQSLSETLASCTIYCDIQWSNYCDSGFDIPTAIVLWETMTWI